MNMGTWRVERFFILRHSIRKFTWENLEQKWSRTHEYDGWIVGISLDFEDARGGSGILPGERDNETTSEWWSLSMLSSVTCTTSHTPIGIDVARWQQPENSSQSSRVYLYGSFAFSSVWGLPKDTPNQSIPGDLTVRHTPQFVRPTCLQRHDLHLV